MSVLDYLKGKYSLEEAITHVSFLFRIPGIAKVHRMWEADMDMEMNTVGPHILNSGYIGDIIAHNEDANPERVGTLIRYHDLPELRGADKSWERKEFVTVDDFKALTATLKKLPHYEWAMKAYLEFTMCETIEAKVAHDAEKLEPVVELIERVGEGKLQLEDIAGSAKAIYDKMHTQTGRDLLTMVFFTERPPRFALLGWQELLSQRLNTTNPIKAKLMPGLPNQPIRAAAE